MDEEIAEQQADITRLLLHHIHAPLVGTARADAQYIRGVLPVPPPAEAVRIVTGAGAGAGAGAGIGTGTGTDMSTGTGTGTGDTLDHPPDRPTVYEFPLREDEDPVTGGEIIAMLRTLLTGTRLYSSDSVSTVMGMTLVRVDPAAVDETAATPADNALAILRGIVCPFTEEQPDPRLRGFLFLDQDQGQGQGRDQSRDQDRLRLYLDTEDVPGVIAADVRPSGAITALLAALPSLITEEERMTTPDADPHCSQLIDLTDW